MKKNENLIYFLVLVVLLAIAGCKSCNQKPVENPPSASIVTYEPGVTIPDYQKRTLQQYEVLPDAKIDAATAQKNALQLLQYADAVSEFNLSYAADENGILIYKNPKDPSANLRVNLSNGDVSLNRGMSAYMGLNATPDLMKNAAAVRMATEHLQKLGFGTGDENSMMVGHVGGVNVAIHDDKEGDKIAEKLTTVRFDRQLDNIPVLGHARLLVQMGSKGTIQSVIKQWAPLSNKMIGRTSVVSREDVKKSIEQHLISENKGAQKIIVKKITLVYYDTGKGMMEPALHIIGEVQMPGGKRDSNLQRFKHDMVEPLLKSPRLSYTFTGEQHTMPKEQDAADNKLEIPKGEDEKKEQK